MKGAKMNSQGESKSKKWLKRKGNKYIKYFKQGTE